MAVEGSLDLFSLPEILQMISQQGKTGILTVQGQQDIVAVSFLLGRIVAADSLAHTVEEGLSKVLVSEGILGAADFARANSENHAAGARLLDFLVERRYLTREQLLAALRLQTVRQLESLLRWQEGDFKFYGGDEVSYEEGFEPIAVEDLLLRMLAEYGALRSPAADSRTPPVPPPAAAAPKSQPQPAAAPPDAGAAESADEPPAASLGAARGARAASPAGSRVLQIPGSGADTPAWPPRSRRTAPGGDRSAPEDRGRGTASGAPPGARATVDRPAALGLPAIPELPDLPDLPIPAAPAPGAGRPLAVVPPPGAARGAQPRPVAPAPPSPQSSPTPLTPLILPPPQTQPNIAAVAPPSPAAAGSAIRSTAGLPGASLAVASTPSTIVAGAPAGAPSGMAPPPSPGEPIPWPAAVFTSPPTAAAPARPRIGAGVPARAAGQASAGGGAPAPPLAPPPPLKGIDPAAPQAGTTLPRKFRQMQIERPEVPFLPRLAASCLALALAASLVAVVRRAPQTLVLPFPWEQAERNGFLRNQRESLFYKIDGAAKTAFLRDGRFPDSLAQLCDSDLLAPADLIDPLGEPLLYSAREDSYTLQATEGGKPLVDAGASESIAGNFLLDPSLVQPNAATGPPVVLLD
jgi:hypothetical protein